MQMVQLFVPPPKLFNSITKRTNILFFPVGLDAMTDAAPRAIQHPHVSEVSANPESSTQGPQAQSDDIIQLPAVDQTPTDAPSDKPQGVAASLPVPANAHLPSSQTAQQTGAEYHTDEAELSNTSKPSLNVAASLPIAVSPKMLVDTRTDQSSSPPPAVTEAGGGASSAPAAAETAAAVTAEAADREEQLPAELPNPKQKTAAEPPAGPDPTSVSAEDNTGSTAGVDTVSLLCTENLSQHSAYSKSAGIASSKNREGPVTAAVVAEPALPASAPAIDVSQADPPAAAPSMTTATPAEQLAQAEGNAVHSLFPADESSLHPQTAAAAAAAADIGEPSEGSPAADALTTSAIGISLLADTSSATQASVPTQDQTPEPAQAPSGVPLQAPQASAPSSTQTGLVVMNQLGSDAPGSALPSDHTQDLGADSAGLPMTDHQASAPSLGQTGKLGAAAQASRAVPGHSKLPAAEPTAEPATAQASAASPGQTLTPATDPTGLPAQSTPLPRVFMPPWTAPPVTHATATSDTAADTATDTGALMTHINQQLPAGKPSAGPQSATASDAVAARPQPKRVTRARQATSAKGKSASGTAARAAGRAGPSGLSAAGRAATTGPSASETTQTTPGKGRGKELVGQRIEVWWSGEKGFFPGTVKSFTSKVQCCCYHC